jgi:hypothetical protein
MLVRRCRFQNEGAEDLAVILRRQRAARSSGSRGV